MARTELEIQSEIDIISNRILIALDPTKKDLIMLRVGSGDFARLYQYSDTPLLDLYKMRQMLYKELAEVTTVAPTFASGKCVPMVGRK